MGRATGSVHTGLSIDELAVGGSVHSHVHAFEESFYILSGEAVFAIKDARYRLRSGRLRRSQGRDTSRLACSGAAPVRGCRWPRRSRSRPARSATPFSQATARCPAMRRCSIWHTSAATCSATSTSARFRPPTSGRTAGAGLEGVFLKWLIDENFGAAPPPVAVHRVPARGWHRAARPHVRRGVFHSERRGRRNNGRSDRIARKRAMCSGPGSGACMRSRT